MRKFLAFALALLLPACALATPATPYDPALMMRYYLLTQTQRTLFDQLYDAAAAGQEKVKLPPDTRYEDVTAVMAALNDDCPELIALSGSYTTSYYQQQPETALSVTLSYALDKAAAGQALAALMSAARELVAGAAGSDWDKELYLHDRLCDRTCYSLDAPFSYTAYGALVNGRAACEGYAEALTLLCRLAGIPCGVVSGTASDGAATVSHAWNLLRVDGTPTLCDPTWDDQESLGADTHWYFNLTAEQMACDHTPDADLPLPACTDGTVSWHARQGTLSPADAEGMKSLFFARLRELVRSGVPVNLRFPTADAFAFFLAYRDAWLDEYNAAAPAEDAFYGAYSLAQSDAQRCFLLKR